MQAGEGKIGRVFMIRLEEGDVVPDCLEKFAEEKKILHGSVTLVGGVSGGQIVVGPRLTDEMPPDPILLPVDGAHEVAGVGTIAPDITGKPVIHIHAALGRAGQTMTGCLRPGVKTWLVGEAVIYEILGVNAKRLPDKKSHFNLMKIKT